MENALLPTGTRYRLLSRLAVGGMAEVYLALAVAPGGLETLVALKRVRPDLACEEYALMFADEIRLVAGLRHPNLVYTLDVAAALRQPFYVMEYLHGCDVRELMKRAERVDERLDLGLALAIVMGAAAGLHHAHDCHDEDGRPLGIVHRDVSPANLFVTCDGRVKVLDFGIASFAQRSTETRVGVVKGKVRYLAPEQLQQRQVDRRSDVFALAICLWELTVGARPFESENDWAVLRAICDRDAPRPSSRVADYPPELEAIVMKGLSRDPDARFASADELRRALGRFARAHRLDDGSHLVAQQLRRWLRDERSAISARYRFDPEGDATGLDHTGATLLRAHLGVPLTEATVLDPLRLFQAVA
jgi:serine/threonine-protein kinase